MEIEWKEFYWKWEIKTELEDRIKLNSESQWSILENFGCKNFDEFLQ